MVEQTSEHATRTSYFVRRVTAMQDFEVFFVSSVATILIVRALLAATGWPQLGGGKIHFAHLLWGGLGMLIALILLMAMQGRLWDQLATLSAGIGFGLFLDELGKFITSDNDYFFEPAVAIMYVLFVVLFFLFRWLGHMDRMSPETALVNSFDFAKEAVMHAMSAAERDEALSVLGRADQADPMVRTLAAALRQVTPPVKRPNVAIMTAARVKSWYRGIIGRRWFQRLVMGWFLLTSVVALLAPIADILSPGELTFAQTGGLISGAITGALVAIGVVRWRTSRLSAFRWFERGVLVAILVGAFFSFYQDQVGAIFGLLWLLVQLAVIRSMIAAQLASSETRPQTTSDGGDHGTHQV